MRSNRSCKLGLTLMAVSLVLGYANGQASSSPSGVESGSTLTQPHTPFGFHPADVFKPGYPDNGFTDAQSIGVQWNRQGPYAFWFIVQPDLTEPVYDFSLYDERYGGVPTDISILANISPEAASEEGYCLPGSWLPADSIQYTDFVEATVERYDGDGVDDMPGLTNPIMYWQVGNEPNLQISPRTDFAALQLMTYQAIKEACPECTVLIGGVAGFPNDYIAGFDEDYAPILAELNGQGVDVLDFHWFGTATGEYRLVDAATGEDVLENIRSTLINNGFSSSLPIWITEMGSYSGDPFGMQLGPQTERQQAGDYFKRFVHPLSLGVEKVFPAYGLIEGFKHDDGYFDHTGLIYDGEGSDDLGLGVKKLSYYTYKKMTDELAAVDWDTVTVLHDGTGSDHLYLFNVEGDAAPIHIAWWDYFDEPDYSPGDTKDLILTGLTGTSLTVTRVVPAAETGLEVIDYATAFTTTTYLVSNGSTTITLGVDPVLAEVDVEVGVSSITLQPPLPNPTSGRAQLAFRLDHEAGHAELAVFDASGRRVATLYDAPAQSGRTVVSWDGADSSGSRVASGVYFLRLTASDESPVEQKLVVIR